MKLGSLSLRMKLIYTLLIIVCVFNVKAIEVNEEVQWVVNDDNGKICLMAEMNIKANFSYVANDSQTKNILYEIPNNITDVNKQSSKCDKAESHLFVEWGIGNTFEVIFKSTNKTYDLSSFKISLNASNIFPDGRDNNTIEITYMHADNDTSFMTPSNFSFHCNRDQILNSTDSNGSFIILSKVQFEAFKHDNNKKFSLAKDCESKISPDIVPIAVGLSLISLIVIVLVAYIVGRRRQQARGYLNIM